MTKVFFREEQQFRQPWIWMIIIPIIMGGLFLFAFGFNKQLLQGEPFGDNPMPDAGLIITGVFSILMMVGLTFLFYNMKLVVEIRRDGLYFRYPPMINKFKKISKEEIEKIEVRQYKPIKEYGGWGIKTGAKNYGKAYNVRGNIGLQLHLKNGNKILFGTQRKDAIRDAAGKMTNVETRQ